jgi:phage tail protein X
MASQYTTNQGEILDVICSKAYGDESGFVEAVLDANVGLAMRGLKLPPRTVLQLPDVEVQLTAVPVVKLWD